MLTHIVLDSLEGKDLHEWNAWVLEKGHAFNTSWFAESCRTIGYEPRYVVFSTSAEPGAGRAIFFTKNFGPRMLGLRWISFFGEPSWNRDVCAVDRKVLFDKLMTDLRVEKPAWVGTTGSMARFMEGQDIPPEANCVPFGTYEINLDRNEQDLWSGVHPKHRNSIRAAQGKLVEIAEENDWDEFFSLLRETLLRSGESCPPSSYVYGVGKTLSDRGCAQLFTARTSGSLQAAAAVLFTRQRAYYWYGATHPSVATGAGNLLQWEIIKRLKSKGVAAYDLGGARPYVAKNSKLEGIQRFKERFGGVYRDTPLWECRSARSRASTLKILMKLKKSLS